MPKPFDVLVIGAGHAGIEAACAAARIGARVGLVTGNLDTIGKMSCNPAIGGMAKGQLAREVDALGGMMGLATDACGIQFRMLGRSKGPAMWSPRAQCDKAHYAIFAKHYIEEQNNVWPIQGNVQGLEVEDGTVVGVRLSDGRLLRAARTVLTTGTFLMALMHQGESKTEGGRMGDQQARGISGQLADLGLKLIRQKTGTPMRVHGDSINWGLCSEQPGDDDPVPFSFLTKEILQEQISCFSCYTTPEAHEAIHENLKRAPMYNGQINSVGPRYCPSIEDKVVRFADRERHHLFLEPEGRETKEVYVNGLSTSLPIDVQDAVLERIPALENAHVLRYGYAVEYDVVHAQQLDHSLACRSLPGLYLAGQINGTSGYEEAAIQGLLAGANAALSLDNQDPLILSRADSYGGVLIDDLVIRAPDEPYRMFTSRAEHRLHLRSDNADRRLTPLAARCGLVDAERAQSVQDKEDAITAALASVDEETKRKIGGQDVSTDDLLTRVPDFANLNADILEQVWIELRYASYLERQKGVIDRLERMRDLRIPDHIDFALVPAISNEGANKLKERQPRTLGEANSIPGVKQTDIENLWAYMQSQYKQDTAAS